MHPGNIKVGMRAPWTPDRFKPPGDKQAVAANAKPEIVKNGGPQEMGSLKHTLGFLVGGASGLARPGGGGTGGAGLSVSSGSRTLKYAVVREI